MQHAIIIIASPCDVVLPNEISGEPGTRSGRCHSVCFQAAGLAVMPKSRLVSAACRSASAGAANLPSMAGWVPRLGGAPRGGTSSTEVPLGPRTGGGSCRGGGAPESPQRLITEASAAQTAAAEVRLAALPPSQAAERGRPPQRPCQQAAAAHEDALFGSSDED